MSRILFSMMIFALLAVPGAFADGFDHGHGPWDLLLKEQVTWNLAGTATKVDYAGFKNRRTSLQGYLKQLSAVSQTEFDRWTREQQLAFLVNAYNAFTVELILSKYPEISSIKELGSFFSSPWKKEFFTLLGRKRSLDDVEHNLIRGSGRYNEPLIHFVVNCASIGCPALRNEAFVAARLEEQLLDSTRRFLQDRTRNRFDIGMGILEVSSIFDWYAGDFARGWRGYGSLRDFFKNHADWMADNDRARAELKKGALRIRFLDYDWKLNSR